MDPKGYFLIKIDTEKNLIRVSYCVFSKLNKDPIHDMIAEVTGKTALEIVNTLIKKNSFQLYNMPLIWALNYIKLKWL